jgi:hypothetical protein
MIELSDAIKQKLSEAIELWADENLVGKPAILANAMFFGLEKEMIKQIEEINKNFGDKDGKE